MATGNSKSSGFPKIGWYSDEPNHRETTLLTKKQKAELKELQELFARADAGGQEVRRVIDPLLDLE